MSKTPKDELKAAIGWNYTSDGEHGPHNWPVVCSGGAIGRFSTLASQLQHQSPIELHTAGKHCVALGGESDPLLFVNYEKGIVGQMANTGRSVMFTPESRLDPPEIYGGQLDQHYRFIQYHYHWAQSDERGSEHTLNGRHFPAELHLVHQGVDDPTKLAVLGIFLQVQSEKGKPSSEALSPDAQALGHVQQFQQSVAVPPQQLLNKLPAEKQCFCRYQGSLTTPPCSENVTWTVFTQPILITKEQLALLRSVRDDQDCVIHCNCRPVQKLHNRTLLICGANSSK